MGRRVCVKLICHLEEGAAMGPAAVGHRLLAMCHVLFPLETLHHGRVAGIAFGGAREDVDEGGRWVSLAGVVGSNVIPGQIAEVLSLALAATNKEPRFMGIEVLAAEYLAGERK